MTTLKQEIERLLELDAARTPGKWSSHPQSLRCKDAEEHAMTIYLRKEWQQEEDIGRPWPGLENREFIASAPDMIAVIRHQQKLLATAREALERLARLGNGDLYGNSDGNVIAQQALAVLSDEQEVKPC